MPVPQQTWRIFADTSPCDRSTERNDEGIGLFLCIRFSVLSGMQASDGECRSDSTRECQLLLQDIEFSEWDCEEHAIVCTGQSEGDELAKVFLR